MALLHIGQIKMEKGDLISANKFLKEAYDGNKANKRINY